MTRPRKTRDVWRIFVNYGFGHGWEHEISEYDIRSARRVLREYRDNAPQYPARMRKGREPIQ